MSHILHLGHQESDLAGATGLISTDAVGFDADYDVNCIKVSGSYNSDIPFSATWAEPAGDVWIGFRYRSPASYAYSIYNDGVFLQFHDADLREIGRIRTESSDEKYHAQAIGDSSVEGASSFIAANATTYWVDVKISVGANITIEFYIDGVLQSTATAANTGGKGKPRRCVWRNNQLTQNSSYWYYAHIAVLDGVSTIGRRFARRRPDTVGTHDQWSGGVDAIKDGDVATRALSNSAGQRLSFSLTGPVGPAGATAIAGVHVKQIAQQGSAGPTGVAGFLRISSTNYDATAGTPSEEAPTALYSSWATNPATSDPWSAATLPSEAGIVSS